MVWIITDRPAFGTITFWTNSNANPTSGTWTQYVSSGLFPPFSFPGSFFFTYLASSYVYIASDGTVFRCATLNGTWINTSSVGLSGDFGLATQVGSTIAIAGGGDDGASGAYKTSTDGGVTWNSYTGPQSPVFGKPVLTNNGSGSVLLGYFDISSTYPRTSKLTPVTPVTGPGSIVLTKAVVTS